MKTVKVCYTLKPYYCPSCYTLYYKEIECNCPNEVIIPLEGDENEESVPLERDMARGVGIMKVKFDTPKASRSRRRKNHEKNKV